MTNHKSLLFLIFSVFISVFLFPNISSANDLGDYLYDNWLQTGEPCNVDVTTSEEEPGSDTSCSLCDNKGAGGIILKWDLSKSGGDISVPLCNLHNLSGGRSYYTKVNAVLVNEWSEDTFNLGLVEQVVLPRPSINTRYQVQCCERDTSYEFDDYIPRCKDFKILAKSKKIWVGSCVGWGSCPSESKEVILSEPTVIGRINRSFWTIVQRTLNFGADPVACTQKVVEKVCSVTIDTFGPGGERISSSIVEASGDAISEAVRARLNYGEAVAVRIGCIVGGKAVEQIQRFTKDMI
ncbi:MAG TPA: hypothetical protein P5274_00920 [Candidatus Paceibacterota bacterium]|nr:hypothetical protein [Candidatus Paceibacterota bacterium]